MDVGALRSATTILVVETNITALRPVKLIGRVFSFYIVFAFLIVFFAGYSTLNCAIDQLFVPSPNYTLPDGSLFTLADDAPSLLKMNYSKQADSAMLEASCGVYILRGIFVGQSVFDGLIWFIASFVIVPVVSAFVLKKVVKDRWEKRLESMWKDRYVRGRASTRAQKEGTQHGGEWMKRRGEGGREGGGGGSAPFTSLVDVEGRRGGEGVSDYYTCRSSTGNLCSELAIAFSVFGWVYYLKKCKSFMEETRRLYCFMLVLLVFDFILSAYTAFSSYTFGVPPQFEANAFVAGMVTWYQPILAEVGLQTGQVMVCSCIINNAKLLSVLTLLLLPIAVAFFYALLMVVVAVHRFYVMVKNPRVRVETLYKPKKGEDMSEEWDRQVNEEMNMERGEGRSFEMASLEQVREGGKEGEGFNAV